MGTFAIFVFAVALGIDLCFLLSRILHLNSDLYVLREKKEAKRLGHPEPQFGLMLE